MARRAQADARRVEVLLLRRLPAEPARLRGRAAGARRAAARSRTSWRRPARPSRARTTCRSSRARSRPPHDAERIREVRAQLARADHDRRVRDRRRDPGAAQLRRRRGLHARSCTPRPDYISHARAPRRRSAPTCPSTSSCNGCPINKRQLLEVISAHLAGRRPRVRAHSVCVECKRRGTVCVMVAHGTPCLGPVTHAGCGAICPAYDRGCYGCYGPMESAQHRVAERAHGASWAPTRSTSCACTARSTPARRAVPARRERGAMSDSVSARA